MPRHLCTLEYLPELFHAEGFVAVKACQYADLFAKYPIATLLTNPPVNMYLVTQAPPQKDPAMRNNFWPNAMRAIQYGLLAALVGAAVVACGGGGDNTAPTQLQANAKTSWK
jgi:Flp pilus assembly pilin Flp